MQQNAAKALAENAEYPLGRRPVTFDYPQNAISPRPLPAVLFASRSVAPRSL